MKQLIITNGKIILPDKPVEEGTVICEDGKIAAILKKTDTFPQQRSIETETIDAKGNYVSPGFIDIHTHGGGGFDFMDGTVDAYLGAAEAHAKFGTTALLPTTLAGSLEELMKTFSVYKIAKQKNKKVPHFSDYISKALIFLITNEEHKIQNTYEIPIQKNIIAYSKHVTISSDESCPRTGRCSGIWKSIDIKNILPSIAHSDAIYEQVVEAFHAVSHITHLYSAMSTVTRRNAFRYAGIVEAAYLIDDMTVEIIADGVHLPKPLMQFVYKFKGPDKTALCTDSMRGAGCLTENLSWEVLKKAKK